jgi:hypothetical protein
MSPTTDAMSPKKGLTEAVMTLPCLRYSTQRAEFEPIYQEPNQTKVSRWPANLSPNASDCGPTPAEACQQSVVESMEREREASDMHSFLGPFFVDGLPRASSIARISKDLETSSL